MKTPFNKFRPSSAMTTKSIMRERRKHGACLGSYNWQSRVKWYPAGWGYNKQVLGGIHSRLHYLACHSPKPIQQKWAKTYKVFQDKHFGNLGKASMRYLNTWSCHSWM